MDSITAFQKIIEKNKNVQEKILDFIENQEFNDNSFQILISYFEQQGISQNKKEFGEILRIISNISANHYRTKDFFVKFEKILSHYRNEILNYFDSNELFEIFKISKRILLFLYENEFIVPNESMFNYLSQNCAYGFEEQMLYFLPEFEEYTGNCTNYGIERAIAEFKKNNQKIIKDDRKSGENNDQYMYQLIRNDSIKEFVAYINETNHSLSETVDISIYETNPFFYDRKPSLIEYAAFYGSIKIFNYINYKENPVKNNSLWLCAIHSNSLKMIHLLESLNAEIEDLSSLIFETIKCHHNDLVKYFLFNFQDQEENYPYFYDHFIKHSNFSGLSNFLSFQSLNEFLKNNSLPSVFYKYGHHSSLLNILKDKNLTIDINAHFIILKYINLNEISLFQCLTNKIPHF